MLRPVGSASPSVYWRRRLLLLASLALLIVLIVLSIRTVFSGGSKPNAAAPSRSPASTTPPPPTATAESSTPSGHRTPSSSNAGSSGAGSSARGSSSVAASKCLPSQLRVQAVVGKSHYRAGDQPELLLQVTNTGPAPCVQDVADSQIALSVYNGASRVWGSHDCKIEPGTDIRTFAVGKPAGFSVVWSGLTSQPGCAAPRQRVGAGTYTLYAALSGHRGTAAQFTIS